MFRFLLTIPDSPKPQLENFSNIPLWPFILAAIVGLFFLLHSIYNFVKSRKPRSRVFPKLTLRRRLYAPYSGGNSASMSFGRDNDA